MSDLRALLDRQLRRVRGVVASKSMFGNAEAYWCNGKEIAHFETDTVIEVRLTRALIRERRTALKADPRVVLRPSGADWLTVRLCSEDDGQFVIDLVRAAAKAHRPPPGQEARPPPSGAELRRRQRFH